MPLDLSKNVLFYGDNLDVLRDHIPDECADLIYLDPPFKSDQNYNVLFAEPSGERSAAQIRAFEDTWEWNDAAARAYHEMVEGGPERVAGALRAFWELLGPSDMLAYLAMMAPRLVELRRALKPTGSIYLHCDPTAGAHLRLLLDAVFGPESFRSEIIWKRTSAHSSARRWGPVHDVVLFYTKSQQYTWNEVFQRLPEETVEQWYNNVETGTGRRYNRADLTAPGVRTGSSGSPWRSIDPSAKGRHWAIPGFVGELVRGLDTLAALDALDTAGRIHWPQKAGGVPMLKRYLEESQGIPAQDVITDVYVNNVAAERLGYPTHLRASSIEGDVVLDPFCGCGTTIDAAQRLGRRWVGIDITHLAIGLIRHRLWSAYGPTVEQTYRVIGEPTDLPGARALALEDRFQFQAWALGLVGARPHNTGPAKKGADKGEDGRLYFHEGGLRDKPKLAVLQVKSGHVSSRDIRDIRGTIEREGAVIGGLLTLEEPTAPMLREAATAGFHTSPWGHHPRIQILTIAQILEGKRIDYPGWQDPHANVTLRRAPKVEQTGSTARNRSLFDVADAQDASSLPDEAAEVGPEDSA